MKLDLGILLCLGGLVWLVHDWIVTGTALQLAVLAGYGLAALGWVMVRVRRVRRETCELAGRPRTTLPQTREQSDKA